MGELLLYIGIITVSTWAVWKGGSLLEESSEKLSDFYHLPPLIQGTIITAVGSSFPELAATVLSTLLHGKFDLGVSAIVGSAIFNILVIPGISAVLVKRMPADLSLIYKDTQYYIISIFILFISFALAYIYHPIVISPNNMEGTMTRWIALIPVVFYGLYLFIQGMETRDYRRDHGKRAVLGVDVDKENINIRKDWIKLIISLVLIVASVEGLVSGAIFLGEFFNTPDFIWGITIVAGATSIPDAVVSIKIARKFKGSISLGNVIGSNIFDLLVAVPVGVLIAGTAIVNFTVAAPLMLFLALITIIMFVFLRTNLALVRWEGIVLLALYVLFVVWMIFETLGITSFVIK
ncbi:sodium:calcium antiporter [Marivirga tractuosa]|uniref:Sodium/calcium exchanger membrane region n=1 Tax=Marivirga tractuosa (strain ATCC 23168 / DSM 4126 / NBRC 15989 / NCIMB 1408 / VKM B-1430 / H-43) TaxID=643867 RepID=E4TPL8_MARTH|nr:sodium:calcium antiporter [Marivirga tractuosa]ADR22582.1 sodium/calcium exchanger membrane region [Marivirga tractuosa DSM 4126]BDD16747.1 sodium:calcium antiporter [Marivirga tractuosa]